MSEQEFTVFHSANMVAVTDEEKKEKAMHIRFDRANRRYKEASAAWSAALSYSNEASRISSAKHQVAKQNERVAWNTLQHAKKIRDAANKEMIAHIDRAFKKAGRVSA